MSKWTHISGLVRIDLYSSTKSKKEDRELRETAEWLLKQYAEDNIPTGSEGPMQVDVKVVLDIRREPGLVVHRDCYALLSLHGDLRDFSRTDFPIIEGWFKRLTSNDYFAGAMNNASVSVRQAILVADDDSEWPPLVLREA